MEPLLSLREGFDPALFLNQEIILTLDEAKIEKVLLNWIESISKLHYDATFDALKLPALKATCREILEIDSIGNLKEGLKAQGHLTPHIETRIEWLSREIFSLLSHPETPVGILRPFQTFYTLGFSTLSTSPQERRRSLEQEATVGSLMRAAKEKQAASKEKILKIFNEEKCFDKRVSLLHTLPDEELYFVLETLFPTLTPQLKIDYLCDLELSQLKEIIYLTDHGLIAGIRASLFEAPEASLKKFKKKLENLLFNLSSYCNKHLKRDLANLADDFRSLDLHEISPDKVQEIEEIAKRIQHEQNIFIKLERLMCRFNWEPLVTSTFEDLGQSYYRSTMRLLPSGPFLTDSLYKILSEKAFQSVADTEEAADFMFENWNFTGTEELASMGLEKDWQKAKNALGLYGLVSVEDLKKNRIYNKVLLKDFINRKNESQHSSAAAAAAGMMGEDIDD